MSSTPTDRAPCADSSAEATRLPALSLSKWFVAEVQPHESQLKSYLRGSFPVVRDVDDVVAPAAAADGAAVVRAPRIVLSGTPLAKAIPIFNQHAWVQLVIGDRSLEAS